jgi:hypothetical protein
MKFHSDKLAKRFHYFKSAWPGLMASLPGAANVSSWPIVLQNSVFANEQNFPEALVHSFENNVGGHMIDLFSNRQPS